ncbi:MAG: hypothetical protein ACO398_09740, partial [Kiritimatiellia bacterium]
MKQISLVTVFALVLALPSGLPAQSLYYDTDPGTSSVDGGAGRWEDLAWKTSKTTTGATNWVDGSSAYLFALTPLTIDLEGNTYHVNELSNADGNSGRDASLSNGVLIADSVYSIGTNLKLGGLDRMDLGTGGLAYRINGIGFVLEMPRILLTSNQTWTDNVYGNGKSISSPGVDLQGYTLEIYTSGGGFNNWGQRANMDMPVSNGSIRISGRVDSAPTAFAYPLDIDEPVEVVSGALGTSFPATSEPFGRSAPVLGANINLAFVPTGGASNDVVYTVAKNA